MKRMPSPWRLVLVLLLVLCVQPIEGPMPVWDEQLTPLARVRQHRNPRRNRERWARRWATWQRRHPVSRATRRRCQISILRQILKTVPDPTLRMHGGQPSVPPPDISPESLTRKRPPSSDESTGQAESVGQPDPLADLRQARGGLIVWMSGSCGRC